MDPRFGPRAESDQLAFTAPKGLRMLDVSTTKWIHGVGDRRVPAGWVLSGTYAMASKPITFKIDHCSSTDTSDLLIVHVRI